MATEKNDASVSVRLFIDGSPAIGAGPVPGAPARSSIPCPGFECASRAMTVGRSTSKYDAARSPVCSLLQVGGGGHSAPEMAHPKGLYGDFE